MQLIPNKTNYVFRVLTESDFECIIDINVKNYIFDMIYKNAVKQLNQATPDIKEIEKKKIPIDTKYYNIIHTSLSKIMRQIGVEIGKDGYHILFHKVRTSHFIKEKELKIIVELDGSYVNK